MLGLRVRGRGGRDPTAPVAAPISAFLWGSTPFLCARAKKWGGMGRASAVYCPRKRRTRVKRKTRRPRHCAFCVCADTLGGGRWLVLRFDPISLVLAQRNGVEPPKKSAFLPRWLHHPRERCQSVDYTFLARLWAGAGAGRGGVRVTAQKEGPPDGGLSSQYLKSCAFSRTMSLTFMRRTLVEFSFSSSFMVM